MSFLQQAGVLGAKNWCTKSGVTAIPHLILFLKGERFVPLGYCTFCIDSRYQTFPCQ